MAESEWLIEDGAGQGVSRIGTRWRVVTDQVMGGVSRARMVPHTHDRRSCLRLVGDVSLENNGGFVQMALDLEVGGGALDASGYTGLRLAVAGNSERYAVHLKTEDVRLPWQSYRAEFPAVPEWRAVDLPFAEFEPHRIGAPLDVARLRRLGIVAIGKAYHADLCLARLALYR
jgi:hypothetical protein